MGIDLRQEIYEYLDKNGIKGSHKGLLSLKFDVYSSEITSNTTSFIFEPNLSKFGLSSDEAANLIIDYVYDTLSVRISSVSDLMNMRSLNGKPFFLRIDTLDNITYCLAKSFIPGSITIRKDDRIVSLGYIEEINGDLGFIDSDICDLGNLKIVNGSLWFSNMNSNKLQSLENLEKVSGDLNLKFCNVTDLGKLTFVGGNLNLRKREPFNLGNLKYVGKNILISKKQYGLFNTDKIEIIGKIKYFEDSE
jgi:hypothetical protein